MTREEAFFAMISKGFSPQDSSFWADFASEFRECQVCNHFFEHHEFGDIPLCKECYLDKAFPFQIELKNSKKKLNLLFFFEKGMLISNENAKFINQLPQVEVVEAVVSMKVTAYQLFRTKLTNKVVCPVCLNEHEIHNGILFTYRGEMISLCSEACETIWEENIR
ncbi:hypothetical protein ACWV26_15765 [Rummeliibacillus sp. JY-2-4R]